jgi:hypothetical protein
LAPYGDEPKRQRVAVILATHHPFIRRELIEQPAQLQAD